MKAALQVSGNLTVCPTPLRLDAYDGCTAGCVYCFARIAALSSVGKGGKTDTFGQVENRSPRIGPRLAGIGKSSEAAMRRLGIPVHLGGMADPLQPCEADRRVTLGFLREVSEAQAPLVVSTKFTLLGQEPWRTAWEAIPQRLLQVSLIAADDALLKAEPGAATWQERLAFVRDMAGTTPTVIRVQPYIRGVSERTLNVLCEQAAEAGARAIIVEGLKLPSRAWAKMDGTLRGAFGQAYQTPAAKSGADRDYPWAEKFAYQLLARKTAKAHGLGHYAADNALRWLGDSANCCATDLMAGEVGTWRANWGHVTEEAMRAGEVRFEWVLHPMMQTAEGGSALHSVNLGNGADSRRWAEVYGEAMQHSDLADRANGGNGVTRRRVAAAYGNVAEIMETNPGGVQVNTANGVKARIRSEHYGTGKQTLAAWYRYVWNQTRSGRGPQAIVPNLIATHRDENGDAVYRFVLPENLREAVQRATGEEITGGYMTAEEATHAPR
ncbi:MAG: hypothetical protein GYA36_23055 [Veillonellaceae bacterium]|nr:hypothetical protein [Veillonellaceae bacterium]